MQIFVTILTMHMKPLKHCAFFVPIATVGIVRKGLCFGIGAPRGHLSIYQKRKKKVGLKVRLG